MYSLLYKSANEPSTSNYLFHYFDEEIRVLREKKLYKHEDPRSYPKYLS